MEVCCLVTSCPHLNGQEENRKPGTGMRGLRTWGLCKVSNLMVCVAPDGLCTVLLLSFFSQVTSTDGFCGLGRPLSPVFLTYCHFRTAGLSACSLADPLSPPGFSPGCFPGDTFSVSHPPPRPRPILNTHTCLRFRV